MATQNNADQASSGCFGLTILGLGIFFIYSTWPFSILLVIGLIGLYLTSESKNLFSTVTRGVIAPVTWGLAIFALVYFIINLFNYFDPSILHSYEQFVVDLRLKTKSWLNVSFPKLIAILVFLLGITFVIPYYKPITAFSKAYKVLQNFTIILATISSFSFFAQKPADNLVNIEHQSRVEQYNILLSEGRAEVGRYVAAVIIQEELKNITPEKKSTLKNTLDSIQSIHEKHTRTSIKIGASSTKYRYSDARNNVITELVEETVTRAKNIGKKTDQIIEKVFQEELAAFEKTASLLDKTKQLKIINERLKFNGQTKIMANEAIKAIEISFNHILGVKGTNIQHLGETFIRKMFNLYSKKMFRTHFVNKINLEKRIELLAERLIEFRPFENSFFNKESAKIFKAASSSSSKVPILPITSRFTSAIVRQKMNFQTNQAIKEAARVSKKYYPRTPSSGYGSGKSTRSYGG